MLMKTFYGTKDKTYGDGRAETKLNNWLARNPQIKITHKVKHDMANGIEAITVTYRECKEDEK